MAEKHIVETSPDGADGSFLGRSFQYDAIILDYSLPKKDGITVCREIRDSGRSTPIIFLSVTDDSEIKVAALESGADDYMIKPFAIRELHARLQAIHRRPSSIAIPELRIGELTLRPDTHLASFKGREIYLTRKEYNMLEYLMERRGAIVSRAQLMERAWTAESDPLSNTIEAHMRNLRKKLSTKGATDIIKTIPGRGYIIE